MGYYKRQRPEYYVMQYGKLLRSTALPLKEAKALAAATVKRNGAPAHLAKATGTYH
jgi:hypothetical protein